MYRFLLHCLLFVFSTVALANSGDDVTGDVKVGAAAVELHATDEMVKNMDNIFKFTGTEKEGKEGQLRAVATVIQGPPGNTRVAIATLDIDFIGRESLDTAARKIEERTRIPFDHILVNSTHNHHAGAQAVWVSGGHPDPAWVDELTRAVVQAVVQANENLKSSPPMTALFKMGREETVGENSRWLLKSGMITAFNFDEAGRPTGPFDPDFPVLAFRRPNHALAAVLFGHSTHNAGTRHFGWQSPGFYGLAAQTFESETGAVTTFLEGASGSTHLLRLDGLPADQVPVEAERRVLDALRYTVDQARPLSVDKIASIRREVSVSVRNFDEEKEDRAVRENCERYCQDITDKKVIAMLRQARAKLAPHRGEERKTWVSVMRIGDVAIVGVPCELFTQLGLDIKERSPFKHTIIVELANDWVGYVGNADAYLLGGFQMWMGEHSWTERGTGELIVNESVSLLNELYYH